jgi:magnesium-protoporphyrin IX monomethyl ester (oxidative) cyclase
MTKILLINPYITVAKDDPGRPAPMLSLPYLAAYLEKNGFKVNILDAAGQGWANIETIGDKKRYGLTGSEISSFIKTEDPDIVGITAPSTSHAADVHDIAMLTKVISTGIKVVVGGAHASSNPEKVLLDRNVDMVVIGEGEETLLDIARRHDKGEPLEGIAGTVVMKDGQLVAAIPRPYIENLDSLPFPSRHLLPMESFLHRSSEGINYAMRKRFISMITSRGCPGECIYCAVKTVWGRRWRARSAANVVDEIEELIKKYNVGEIHFLDDSMSVSKERLSEICDEIIRRKLNIKWTTPNGIAIWLMDKPLLRKMKKAGCYRLTFGLESGNKETLSFIGKRYDYADAKELINYANRVGLWTIGTFIIGFPYEKKESIENTISFAIDSGLSFAVFYIANPFPGTRMYEYYVEADLIPKDASIIVRGVDTKEFSHSDLVRLQSEAFSRFMRSRLRRPWGFLLKIRNLEDLSYMFKLGRQFAKMLLNSQEIEKEGIASLWKD